RLQAGEMNQSVLQRLERLAGLERRSGQGLDHAALFVTRRAAGLDHAIVLAAPFQRLDQQGLAAGGEVVDDAAAAWKARGRHHRDLTLAVTRDVGVGTEALGPALEPLGDLALAVRRFGAEPGQRWRCLIAHL